MSDRPPASQAQTTMSTSPQSLAGLSLAEKRMLLAQLLQEKAHETSTVFPLSHGQRGLWFLDQIDRNSPAYNICYASRIRSPLDLNAFRRALETLVDRHPGLRTTFEEREGVLLQRVHERPLLPLEMIDASGWTEAELHQRLEADAHRPFDLERGPLVRMQLFTRSETDHIFSLCAHHILGDYWSLALVVDEMRGLYPAECTGRPAALPAPGKHYRDFVQWQAQMLASADGERLWAYWKHQLETVPAVLELPTDKPRPLVFSRRGAAIPWRVEKDLLRRLRAVAAAEGVTLYTVLMATFQVLLERYTEQRGFLVGSPFAGRNRPGFERVIGYFINMVPIRADLSGDPKFRSLLKRVGVTVLEALEHQDYPFPLLVERLARRRDLSRAPLVQVTFTLDKAPGAHDLGSWRFFQQPSGARLEVGDLKVEQYYVELHTSQHDLEMVIEEGDSSLEAMLRYNCDLFEQNTARRMVDHFLTLLAGVAENADRRISELPWLSDAERRLVLSEWNQTQVAFPPGLCLHHLFEQQAARTPQAIAISSDEGVLTYAELDARSNALAHRLRWRGVGSGTLVGLFLERSPAMVAAMLGTLKAGAAYVPLDTAAPADRLRLVLADTASPIVITQRMLAGRLPKSCAQILCIDEPGSDGTEGPSTPVESGVRSSDLAYVIYTSGSTGRPKGVMVEHRAICNTVCWRQRDLPILADDRVMFNLPYTFDPSLCIIFPTLAAGARLVLARPGEEYDPHEQLRRVLQEGVTVLEAPPFVLRMMIDDPMFATCHTLRWVCCGGEAMPRDLPKRLLELHEVAFYNLYGPTETAVDATWWACQRDDSRPTIPIGRPTANVQAYVLDRAGKPVAPGVPGELYIGGAGLARGYLNDPALTAERFLPDPFSNQPGARLYRTGDRCRWLADGALEFLGRIDQQVKVRGFRVELGEVEAALIGDPMVREAAVIADTIATGETRLVAYIAMESIEHTPSPELLRRSLRSRLPDYMVPSSFVFLSALPRTSGGKLDRRALPPPTHERPDLARPYVAPRTPLEEFLAGLWREVLHLEKVGVEDNFFELGGSSVQGALLINRLQEQLGQHVYVIALFDSPTIAGLAHHLGESYPDCIGRMFGVESLPTTQDFGNGAAPSASGSHHRVKPAELVVALQPEGSKRPCFMVHPPGGIIVCYQAMAHRMGRERPFYGIRSRGLHGEESLPGSMEEMAADYIVAIREIQPEGPYYLGGWSVGGLAALEMAQQLIAEGEQIGLLALLDTTPTRLPDLPLEPARSGREYGLDITLEELARLGPNEQLPYLWKHALRLGLIGPDVPLEVAQQVLDDLKRLFHLHMQLADNYTLQRYAGKITLFRPSESPVAVDTQRDRGWGHVAAAVDVHFTPGQHHSMVKEPHVQVLARTLHDCLRRVESSEGT